MNSGFFDSYVDPCKKFYDAFATKKYPLIYKTLRGETSPFSAFTSACLLDHALMWELSLKVFETILENSPPLPEVLAEFSTCYTALGDCGLVEKSAYMDRADVLALFLERGAGPNRTDGFDYSPLEAAVMGESPKSVKVLICRPELDTSWTESLLYDWAAWRKPFPSRRRRLCVRAMAPRFTGWEPESGLPLPIPEPMTPEIIVHAQNWPLLERFIRERTISPEAARKALSDIRHEPVFPDDETGHITLAAALDALLRACPDLLRAEEERRSLLLCFLMLGRYSGRAVARLRPWVEGMCSSPIALDYYDWRYTDSWQRLLPNGPDPVIDRWSGELEYLRKDYFSGSLTFSEVFRRTLDICPIRGEGQKGQVSPLAKAALRCGDGPLIGFLFREPDGLLATEDPDALIDFALQREDIPPANRAAVLAYLQKDENYNL